MAKAKKTKNQNISIILADRSADCPKITYTFTDSPESVQKLNEVYDMIFDQVLKSESWKKYKSEHHN
jgi:hypothetical protein